jgi:AraC-like DNA-binding protein
MDRFASVALGFEQRPAWEMIPRHRHRGAYLSLVLEGSYEETGDRGRIQVHPGDMLMLIHGAFDSHLNRFPAAGARILNLTLDDGIEPETGFARSPEADTAIRLAEEDPRAAAELLVATAVPAHAHAGDWPDLLADALAADPALRIGDWAHDHGLADATVSRGFLQVYGISPSAFRAQLRGRLAWRRIVNASQALTDLAYELGFSDQAHMTRTVCAITGQPPRVWRAGVK